MVCCPYMGQRASGCHHTYTAPFCLAPGTACPAYACLSTTTYPLPSAIPTYIAHVHLSIFPCLPVLPAMGGVDRMPPCVSSWWDLVGRIGSHTTHHLQAGRILDWAWQTRRTVARWRTCSCRVIAVRTSGRTNGGATFLPHSVGRQRRLQLFTPPPAPPLNAMDIPAWAGRTGGKKTSTCFKNSGRLRAYVCSRAAIRIPLVRVYLYMPTRATFAVSTVNTVHGQRPAKLSPYTRTLLLAGGTPHLAPRILLCARASY